MYSSGMSAAAIALVLGTIAASQQPHPAVCAAGVRDYGSLSEITTPYDTVRLPPGPPIQVTNEDEARAAQQQMKQRAGSVGATGLVTYDQEDDDGSGARRMRRTVMAVFVPADTARAYGACRPH